MHFFPSLSALFAGLVAAAPLATSDSPQAFTNAPFGYILGVNATVGQRDNADGIIELCPQPDFKGDCFTWGYSDTVCWTHERQLKASAQHH